MLSEHYKKLVHKFTNNCRKDEDEDREEMFEDIKWEIVKEMRPCLKNDILRSFTPRSAIDYLPADLDRKPNDESDLLQQINMYLSKYTTLERFQRGSNTLCAVHRLMRKTGFLRSGTIYQLHCSSGGCYATFAILCSICYNYLTKVRKEGALCDTS